MMKKHLSGQPEGVRLECYLMISSLSGKQSACWWIEPDDPGGGSESGGGYNPPVMISDDLKKIAKEVSMSQNQVTRLNTARYTFINEGCMQRALVRKNVKLDFGMYSNPTATSAPANYNPYEKSLTFSEEINITSASLKEELFHAWQDAYYFDGIGQYGKYAKGNKLPGFVNVEFEAKVFKDLLDNPEIYYGCCYAINPVVDNLPENLYKDYTDWIFNVRDKKTILQDSEYQKWLNLFNQYNTEYSSPMHHNLSTPNAIMKLMNQSDCF